MMMLAHVDKDQGLWRPSAMFLQPNIHLRRPNVTLEGLTSPYLGLFYVNLFNL